MLSVLTLPAALALGTSKVPHHQAPPGPEPLWPLASQPPANHSAGARAQPRGALRWQETGERGTAPPLVPAVLGPPSEVLKEGAPLESEAQGGDGTPRNPLDNCLPFGTLQGKEDRSALQTAGIQ